MATHYTGPWFSYPTPDEIMAAATVLPVLGIVVVGLRFYARRVQQTSPGVDDWLVVPALFTLIGMAICLIYGVVKQVFGYPSPPLNLADPTSVSPQSELLQKLEYGFLQPMILTYGFIKISVLCFFRRLFNIHERSFFDYATRVFIALVIVWTIGFYFAFAFVCGTHFDKYWGNVIVSGQYCPHGLEINEGLLISDFITDFIILCIPFPIIWRLHMSFARKMAITGIFLIGTMSIAASAVRLALFTLQVARGYDPEEDINLAISTQLYWCMIEAGLGLIVTCLPSFSPFFNKKTLNEILRSARSTISLFSLPRGNSTEHELEDNKTLRRETSGTSSQ